MAVSFSIVIPAYNEANRLPSYLFDIKRYCSRELTEKYEVIVVNDGSRDDLVGKVQCLTLDWPELSLVSHSTNQGKGAALRTGMLAAQGSLFLLADADGATPIEEERKLRSSIEQGAVIAIGSRLVPRVRCEIHRFWHRQWTGKLFALAVRTIFGLPIWDTQCGFKMFVREAALTLCHLSRDREYLFELEMLLWAHRLGYRIDELPVAWRDVPGSKVHVMRDSWKMLRGLWTLRGAISCTKAKSTQVCQG